MRDPGWELEKGNGLGASGVDGIGCGQLRTSEIELLEYSLLSKGEGVERDRERPRDLHTGRILRRAYMVEGRYDRASWLPRQARDGEHKSPLQPTQMATKSAAPTYPKGI